MIATEEANDSTKALDKSRRDCTISEEMAKLLLRQLSHEMYNHNLYRSFSSFFGVQGLTLLEKYYNKRADEEFLHASWIMHYLSESDVEYVFPEIPKIEEDWEDLEDPFKLTVDLEIKTTQLIYEMVDLAQKEHDWITFNWLMGHDDESGKLVMEQAEEESLSRTVLDIATSEGSWLRKEKSILEIYEH